MPSQPFEFVTPKKGVIKLGTFTDHNPDSAVDALNVLPFDRQGRFRANQRGGTSKLWASSLGTGIVQLLDQTTIALDPLTITANTNIFNELFNYTASSDLFTQADGTWASSSSWLGSQGTGGWSTTGTSIKTISTGPSFWREDSYTLGTAYVVRADILLAGSTVGKDYKAGYFFRNNKTTPALASTLSLFLAWNGTGGPTLKLAIGNPNAPSTTIDSQDLSAHITQAAGTTVTLELRVNGNNFQGYVNGTLYVAGTSSTGSTQSGVGGFAYSNAVTASLVEFQSYAVYVGTALASYRQTNIVAVAGGSVYVGDIDTQATVATSGTTVLSDTVLPQGAYTTGKYYLVDGVSIVQLDLATATVETYTATAGTAPTGCTLAAVYRDRLVLAAPGDNPQNFYFSRVGTHTDWDYSQTDSAAAFAGNASVAGRIGEPIVALMPFTDDVMMIGGDHNLWAIRGDPADGGSIDMVSDAIGILGPRAWTKAPDGTIYFVGTGGLYRMAGGSSTPVNISSDKWNDFFKQIDRGTSYVRMAWDRDRQGAYIFVTPANTGTATHLWYDLRTDSLWPIQFPDNHGPISALVYDGDGPSDRALLLGGRAGYVRKLSDTTIGSDDGTAISSYIYLGPYKSSDVTEAILEWVDVILGEPQTGQASTDYNVKVQVLAGQTAEKAFSTPLYTRSKTYTSARRQIKWLHRTRGAYFWLKLSNSTLNKTWNFEKAAAMFLPGGLVRRR